jgi:hypothetical protein
MDTFQMDWEDADDIATYDYEYSSPSPDSTSSVRTSRTFGNLAPQKTQEFRASYDSAFSASLTSSNNSSQLSSPVLRRNDSQRSGFYDIDYDSDSSDSDPLDDEHVCPSHTSLKAIIRSYLRVADEINTAEGLRKALTDIYELSQAQNYHSFEPEAVAARSNRVIPLDSEAQICTALLLYPSSATKITKLCEEHLIILASTKGNIMSSGTTESHFDIWLEDENCRLIFGWQIHAQIYRLMALRDSLQGHLGFGGNALDDGTSLNVASAVRKREIFLSEVLKVPVNILLRVDAVRGVLRPVEGG